MKIKICGNTWKIKECANTEIPLSDGVFFGRCFYFEKEIYLNKAAKKSQKRNTLAHELAHAFMHETQIIPFDETPKYTEENLAEFVALYAQEICRLVDLYFKRKKKK